MEWFGRAWQGEEKLWSVFWVYGLIIGIILYIMGNGANVTFAITHSHYLRAGYLMIAWALALIIFSAFVVCWWCIAVWQCALNAKLAIWQYAARSFCFLVFSLLITAIGPLSITLVKSTPRIISLNGALPQPSAEKETRDHKN